MIRRPVTRTRLASRSRTRSISPLFGVGLGCFALIAAPRLAHADNLPPPSPTAATSSASDPSASPVDDTRFSEIGHPAEDAEGNDDKPPVSAGIAATNVGHVTYAGARVDVPVSKRWSLIPQVAFLHVSPFNAGDRATVNPYLGGGVGYRPAEGWAVEASGIYGPLSYGLESVGGEMGLSHEIGGDWSKDIAPPVALDIAISATRFRWADGLGPAGPNVLQAYLQVQALLRATRRLSITPRGMLFVYDHALTSATGERLGTVSTLARIGSYAPAWMGAIRASYLIGKWFSPFVDVQQIGYAASIGHATELVGGARFELGKSAYALIGAGAIFNRVGGPLVPPDYDLRTVPVVTTEVEWAF